MSIDVRFAALSSDLERRLRLSTRTLAAFGREARCSEWDGTRCDLVVTDARDAYGQRVISLAARRNIPVIVLGGSEASAGQPISILPEDVSTSALTRAMQESLSTPPAPEPARPAPMETESEFVARGSTEVAEPQAESGLQRLALDAVIRKGDILARSGTRAVYLLRSQGRVLASTLSDQLEARNQLARAGWEFSPAQAGDALRARAEVTGSLDVFLLRAALRAESTLPPFPDRPTMLREWPDLGSAPELSSALTVAAVLVRAASRPDDVARVSGQPIGYVGACLWAFQAGDLLVRESLAGSGQSITTRTPAARAGLIARLASHFGLGR